MFVTVVSLVMSSILVCAVLWYFIEPMLVVHIWTKFRLVVFVRGVNFGPLFGGLLLTRVAVGIFAAVTAPPNADMVGMFNQELPRQKRFCMFLAFILNSDLLNSEARERNEHHSYYYVEEGENSYRWIFPLLLILAYFCSTSCQLFRMILRFHKDIIRWCGDLILRDAEHHEHHSSEHHEWQPGHQKRD
jgi:hypothetical protein